MDLSTSLLMATAGAGATYMVARALHNRTRVHALQRRFSEFEVDLPLRVEHLSAPLGTLAVSARVVRRLLETPLVRVQAPALSESPWRLRERLGDYDLALADARHAIWEWLRLVAKLEAADIAVLREFRLDPRPLRSLMYAPGIFDRDEDVFDAPLWPRLPDLGRVEGAMCEAMQVLHRFEVALLSYRRTPYR